MSKLVCRETLNACVGDCDPIDLSLRLQHRSEIQDEEEIALHVETGQLCRVVPLQLPYLTQFSDATR